MLGGGGKLPLRATVHWIKIEGTVENHFTDISGECHDENLGKKSDNINLTPDIFHVYFGVDGSKDILISLKTFKCQDSFPLAPFGMTVLW